MSVRDTLMVNQNTDEEALGIKNDVDKTGKSMDDAISAAKEEILTKVGETSSNGGVIEYAKPCAVTFVVPNNVYAIYVTACGGGAGGGCDSSRSSSKDYGGGGGGAAIYRYRIDVKPLQSIPITVGAGGKGSVGDGTIGNKGESTVIGEFFTLAGGYPGYGEHKGGSSGGYGGGNGGLPNSAGTDGVRGKGGASIKDANSSYAGGGGGGSLGNGGNGRTVKGDNGEKGGGGGGAYYSSASTVSGGNGGDGYVKLEWGVGAV